ncbi:MAG: GNAT family N-acetyltransferase [Dehalococcoidia bacterium]|jgi:phosphinothricin acetyltransferase
MFTIRPAVATDLGAITDIYNQAILNTVATFDTSPKTAEEQKGWFDSHGPYPLLVALQDGVIVGWASLSAWSDRCAYSKTAEISCYVREDSRGRGIGEKLSVAIVRAGREAGLHTLIARIAEGNAVSVHIAESLGFEHAGVMKEVGHKFGRWLDVYIMQKIYDRPGS